MEESSICDCVEFSLIYECRCYMPGAIGSDLSELLPARNCPCQRICFYGDGGEEEEEEDLQFHRQRVDCWQ